MRSVERDIEAVLEERIAVPGPAPESIMRRIEDFALGNMRSLAFGAIASVACVAIMAVFSDAPPPGTEPANMAVGSIATPVRISPRPEWQTARKPVEIISLQAPQFDRVPQIYTARSSDQGVREDSIAWNHASVKTPDARIALVRQNNTSNQPSLFIEMVRLQAERGVAVLRSGTSGPLPTKFGALEAADMTFADQSGQEQACLTFRSAPGQAKGGITGWYCAQANAAVERPEVACWIDRLTLLRAGEDQELRKFFTEAEQRRRPCPTVRASTGRKPTWLDSDGKTPGMRGDVTGTIPAGATQERRKQRD
jgi:hypothetical protein